MNWRSWLGGSTAFSGIELERVRGELASTQSKLAAAERDRNNSWALLTTIHQMLNQAHRGKCRVEWDDDGNFCLYAESEDGEFKSEFKSAL